MASTCIFNEKRAPRMGMTLIELLVVLVIVAILAAVLLPVFGRSGHGSLRSSCQSNLKQVALGVKQYVIDWDEKYPLLNVSRQGYWAGSLQPYLKNWDVFRCPSRETKVAGASTDYYFNSRLAGRDDKKIEFLSNSIMLGDGTFASSTNYSLRELPQRWRDDLKSPIYRHRDGANYAFPDGHVKWLKPEKVSSNSPTKSQFTFALK